MPFKSKAQRRLFYARPELRKYAKEWEQGTPKKLPEHVKGRKHALLRRMKGRGGK